MMLWRLSVLFACALLMLSWQESCAYVMLGLFFMIMWTQCSVGKIWIKKLDCDGWSQLNMQQNRILMNLLVFTHPDRSAAGKIFGIICEFLQFHRVLSTNEMRRRQDFFVIEFWWVICPTYVLGSFSTACATPPPRSLTWGSHTPQPAIYPSEQTRRHHDRERKDSLSQDSHR